MDPFPYDISSLRVLVGLLIQVIISGGVGCLVNESFSGDLGHPKLNLYLPTIAGKGGNPKLYLPMLWSLKSRSWFVFEPKVYNKKVFP